jgi:leader peptidase (prepilin peptidase)/N-methyltransferase
MIIAILIVLGLCLGSFIDAFVWRLHYRETKTKGKIEPKYTMLRGRSMCPNCKHELGPLDLIPFFSWLFLAGKCRYCHKPISWQSPLIEILMPILLVLSYVYWPRSLSGFGLVEFIFWIVFVTGLVALALYDAKWFILPNKIVYSLIALAGVQVIINLLFYHGGVSVIEHVFWGLIISSGIFFLLFQISGGKWIGGGDVKLGFLIGILVGGPIMSVLVLVIASLSGTLFAFPSLLNGRSKMNSKIPFGPFLILIVRLFGMSIFSWYKGLLQ